MKLYSYPAVLACSLLLCAESRAQWKAAEGPLMTRWSGEVSPENALPEYPRPQMRRDAWVNLNGLWEYAVRPVKDERPASWDGRILVPYPVESALSGVMRKVGPEDRLWYRRSFETPEMQPGGRLLLHFGAVDYEARVWVNGELVGEHAGGYDAFSLDITGALRESGPQELLVSVWDPTDKGYQATGKQVLEPHGIWYTAVTGIWQTVWLEPVPKVYIRSLKLTPDLQRSKLHVEVEVGGEAPPELVVTASLDRAPTAGHWVSSKDGKLELVIGDLECWTPKHPRLYPLYVSLRSAESGPEDAVESYFGKRSIAVKKDVSGVPRFFLNGQPLFHYGTLDQGWWPDGLYTAPTDAALRYDVEITKRMGFNMIRKHVKVEPARWYYHCDQLGIMVWQDLPSSDRSAPRREGEKRDHERSPASVAQYERELAALVDGLYNHPCIVMWVPFNEGWGQFDTPRITDWVERRDPSRLVVSASGWSDYGVGSAHDIHSYPGPAIPPLEERRAVVLGEFGGLGLPLKGHTWQAAKNWGYRSYDSRAALQAAYLDLQRKLRPLVYSGLAGAVYTQTTDVEIEVNGLLTYDRAVIKMDPDVLGAAHRKLYLPPPRIADLVPTSEKVPQHWRFTTEAPAKEWHTPAFDDTSWKLGEGGFGQNGTPGAVVRTGWESPDIWLRRDFELRDAKLSDPHLRIHHDEDAEIYINGELVAEVKGYARGYTLIPIASAKTLRAGTNTLAVHCHQTRGGQYIDVGIVDLE